MSVLHVSLHAADELSAGARALVFPLLQEQGMGSVQRHPLSARVLGSGPACWCPASWA
jgi:hypothetical protein